MNLKQITFAEFRREAIKLLAYTTAQETARILNDKYHTHFLPSKILDIASKGS